MLLHLKVDLTCMNMQEFSRQRQQTQVLATLTKETAS